jgi:selenium-binding protein 1
MNKKVSKKSLLSMTIVAALAMLAIVPVGAEGFSRHPVFVFDGIEYYWEGAPDGPNGEKDVPGHYWVKAGPRELVAKHYNTGPFGAPQWWSSDAPDGELLYMASVIIDEWTPEKAADYFARGYTHYHEFVQVSDKTTKHPTLVGWFKHTARTTFTRDRGPRPDPDNLVTPGIDYNFIPNWDVPYAP